jgi:glycosyltransferase involved in cell wall biosynthesis
MRARQGEIAERDDRVKISVVTVAWNAAETIGETLRSVARQTWPEVEHVVIDGGSPDDTGAIVGREQRAGGIYVSEPDKGLYDAMNKGIARATGDVIGLLNADDHYSDEAVLERVSNLFEREGVDAVLGDAGFFRPESPDRIFRRYNSGWFRPGRLGWGWMPAHPAMFLTREAYERVGPYRTDYRIAADFEFVARAFGGHGLTYAYLPEILVRMRVGGLSTAGLSASRTILRESLRACRENGIYSNRLMLASKYPIKLLEYLR